MIATVIPSTSDLKAVGAASVAFDTTMVPNVKYMLVSTTLCWAAQGAAPVASAADGSFLIPPNVPVLIDGTHGAKLALIQHTAAGQATLVAVKV